MHIHVPLSSLRLDEWHLWAVTSPASGGGRGFVLGEVFARDGTLVASVCQEGLIRRRGGARGA
jgi:acyl-CoA thioesterase-2